MPSETILAPNGRPLLLPLTRRTLGSGLKSLCRAQGLVQQLFAAVQPKLAAQGQDLEVKEAAISCAASAVAGLGDQTSGEYLEQVKVRPAS